MTPTLKSKIARGYRPVNRMANRATSESTAKAAQRKNSTIACGMIRSHLISQRPREGWSGCGPAVTWTG